MWPTIVDMDPVPITADEKKECGVQALWLFNFSKLQGGNIV